MEPKTKIQAEENKQEIIITRDFDLPVEMLFRAYQESEIFEQWMGTKVLKWDNQRHGSYAFETSHQNNVVFKASGTIHEFIPNQQIIRTFEMENTPFPVQLEYLNFENVNQNSSRLLIQIIFQSVAYRNQLLQLPFAQGINMAHNRLQEIVSKLH